MSTSKFLRFQDKDGDSLIDVCNDVVDIKEEFQCPPCMPNPYATIPNWKELDETKPFFNPRKCMFEVTIQTPYTSTIAEEIIQLYEAGDASQEEADSALSERFEEFVDIAVESLLTNNSRENTPDSRNTILQGIEFTDIYLDPRPTSRLKLLYSVSFETMGVIAESDDFEEEDQESEAEEEAESDLEGEDQIVTYIADEIRTKLNRVRKGLNLYSKYLKVHRAVEGGNILKIKNNSVFNLQNYGDAGLLANSTLGKILTDLDDFLVSKGLNIVGVGSAGLFKEKVTRLDFHFNEKYKLKKLKVYSAGCGDKPFIYGAKKLKPLNAKDSWKDPTAVAYFAQLDRMSSHLTAAEPQPWIDFIVQFTYPAVYSTFDDSTDNTAPTRSCVAAALENETKQLGQDILDSAFSIGDAVVYAFRKNICLNGPDELLEEDYQLGLRAAPDASPEVSSRPRNLRTREGRNTIRQMATEQAFATIEDTDQIFQSLCAKIADFGNLGNMGGAGSVNLDLLWTQGFDKIKTCGMFDFAIEASHCLLKGLSLEEAGASILKAAIRGMNLDNLSDFFLNQLPPEKQSSIEELVSGKLSDGNIFKSGTDLKRLSADIQRAQSNTQQLSQPDADQIIEDRETSVEGPNNSMVSRNPTDSNAVNQKNTRTIAQTIEGYEYTTNLSNRVVLEAYIAALIEVYQDDILSAIELLNRYPGANIIANFLAYFDCPQAPIMNPSIPDFINSLELPICSDIDDWVIPKLSNPVGWIPSINDYSSIFFDLFKQAIQQLVISLVTKLLLKICSLISGSICKTLEAGGSLALSGFTEDRQSFRDIIRDSICGEDADDEQIDDTINDLFEQLGAGGAALADEENLQNFISDFSSATTQSEFLSAFMGDPSPEMLTAIDNLLDYEYEELREGLPNKQAIANFFENTGNLMPADVREAMKDALNNPPDSDLPANPSICATPEQLEDFCNIRTALLAGRATTAQAVAMCEDVRNDLKNDLEDLQEILQGGLPAYINNNMPPMVSEPGCDDGMIPFESEEAQQLSADINNNMLESIRMAFLKDMMNNGPGSHNWGFMNMVMSDTKGNPLSAHNRYSFFRNTYVDYYSTNSEFNEEFASLYKQEGAYPYSIAGWLQKQFSNGSLDAVNGGTSVSDLHDSINYSSNNEYGDFSVAQLSFANAGLTSGLYGRPAIELYNLPDFGYNTISTLSWEGRKIFFTRKGRKAEPDLTLQFKDNAKGMRTWKNSPYSYGFDVKLYFGDLESAPPETLITEEFTIHNVYSDNVRVMINEKFNPAAYYDSPIAGVLPGKNHIEPNFTGGETDERQFEFLVQEDTFNNIDVTQYSNFIKCFSEKSDFAPQVVLLYDMLNGAVSQEVIKGLHDDFMTSATKTMANFIAENGDMAFKYGMKIDTLTREDTEYVLGQGYEDSGKLYGEAEIEAEDEDGNTIYRKIINDDMILGVSKMQYQIETGERDDENRVFYLDPATYGLSYMSPKIYIKPIEGTGWVGILDAFFPEMTECKNKSGSDIVNFSEIEKLMGDRRNKIPVDKRLKAGASDCVVELPYNRILTRESTVAIEGIITSTIRIFVTTHFLKSLATFLTFKPDFKNVFSDMYASYIVENMELVLKGGSDEHEDGSMGFSDGEFWYAFLEQAVQTYGRRVDDGDILDPSPVAIAACTTINDMQANYNYPSTIDFKRDKEVGRIAAFKTLKNYRQEQNLNQVYYTRKEAKTVLKELVIEQIEMLTPNILQNLKNTIGAKPMVEDMGYYILENYVEGSSLVLNEDTLVEGYGDAGLPTEAESELYTYGGEFSVYIVNEEDSEFVKGQEYVGYYHTHLDEDNNLVFMTGPEHVPDSHNVLKPFAPLISVPIGEVSDYGSSLNLNNSNKPFILEKYISINGTKYSSSDAVSQIQSNTDLSVNLADIYPGSLELITNDAGIGIGISGNIGVRHGLLFSVAVGGNKVAVVEVEVDALDLPLSKFQPLQNNSKLLLCLINLLKESDKFKLITEYVFPMKKIASSLAIYNDMAFLPSIGEITVNDGSTLTTGLTGRPGMRIEQDSSDPGSYNESFTDGWLSAHDRNPGFWSGWFVREWDNWEQVLLKKSKKRIKRMFRQNYNYRNRKLGEFPELQKPSLTMSNNLRDSLRPSPGEKLLPWWKRRKLRPDPFDSKGNKCEKE